MSELRKDAPAPSAGTPGDDGKAAPAGPKPEVVAVKPDAPHAAGDGQKPAQAKQPEADKPKPADKPKTAEAKPADKPKAADADKPKPAEADKPVAAKPSAPAPKPGNALTLPAQRPAEPPVRRAVPLTPMTKPEDQARVNQRIDSFDERARARPRFRHLMMLLSFLLLVAAPLGGAWWYLWHRAADQYASNLGFLVQTESSGMPMDALSGIVGGLAQSSSSNTDILFKFIQSQSMVERVNQRVNLREVWSRHPEDVVFGYRGTDAIEDLMAYWERQVRTTYDRGTLDLRVLAFTPEDAQRIAQVVMDESQIKINQINDIARADKLRYAQDDLNRALDRLKEARNAVSTFRGQNQIVDPQAYAAGQEGVLTTLQQQLAEALIQLGIVKSNAPGRDQRVEQAQLRVDVIREQIEAERARVSNQAGAGTVTGPDGTATPSSDIYGRYEALEVERVFAEQIYTTAMAAFERARSEADRQSLYLAAYVTPTLAQVAEYPRRVRLLCMLGGFLMLGWMIGVMIFYSVRDRR